MTTQAAYYPQRFDPWKYGRYSGERCPKKVAYDDWASAEAAAQLLMDDLREGKLRIIKTGNVLAYQCDVCGLWHIGHCFAPKNPWNNWRRKLVSSQARTVGR